MSEHKELLKLAIEQAGGQSAVAAEVGIAQPSVWSWLQFGLPRTEYTGETQHAKAIERLQVKRQIPRELRVTRKMLLNSRRK